MLNYIFMALIIVGSLKASEWKLRKDADDIQVYTRHVAGSEFEEFRAVVEIKNSSVQEILHVIFDVDEYISLFPDCLEANRIKKYDSFHQIHYTVTKGPWPVDDRDGVYEMKATISDDNKHATVSMITVPDVVEKKKKRVRLKDGVGKWSLTTKANDRIEVQFQFHGEAGGGVPAWIANSFIISYPYGTMKNLRSRIEGQKKE